MKKLLSIGLLALPLLASSQGFNGDTGCDCFSNKKKGDKIPFYIGLNGGYFLQHYTTPAGTKFATGAPYGGLIFGAHVTSFLSIQSGVNYSQAYFTYSEPPYNFVEPGTLNIQYLEIPLEIQLRLIVYRNFTVYLQPGVYNNVIFKTNYGGVTTETIEDNSIRYNRMYAGGALGFGYIFAKKWMLFAQTDYHTMIMDSNIEIPNFTSRLGGRVGITYTFRRKKS